MVSAMTKKLAIVTPSAPSTVSVDYADFDRWIVLAQTFSQYRKSLIDAHSTLDDDLEITPEEVANAKQVLARFSREFVQKTEAEVNRGRSLYEADELCEPGSEYKRLTRAFVAYQIALLLGAFSNFGPHDPKMYTAMLIDEVYAAQFESPVALEIACRTWRRTQEWIPSGPAQLLKAIRAGAKYWKDIETWLWSTGDNDRADCYYDELKKLVASHV
jgi:hypothetical protein